MVWGRLEAPKEGLMMGYGITSERESQMIAEGIIVSSPDAGRSIAQTPTQDEHAEASHEGQEPAAEREDVLQEEKTEGVETPAEREEQAPVADEEAAAAAAAAAEHEEAPQEEKKEETPTSVETEGTEEEGN